jgi:hypothetical protein
MGLGIAAPTVISRASLITISATSYLSSSAPDGLVAHQFDEYSRMVALCIVYLSLWSDHWSVGSYRRHCLATS